MLLRILSFSPLSLSVRIKGLFTISLSLLSEISLTHFVRSGFCCVLDPQIHVHSKRRNFFLTWICFSTRYWIFVYMVSTRSRILTSICTTRCCFFFCTWSIPDPDPMFIQIKGRKLWGKISVDYIELDPMFIHVYLSETWEVVLWLVLIFWVVGITSKLWDWNHA